MLIKQKPDHAHHLLTPSLSPSLHPVTPDSDVGPHSPPSNRSQQASAFENDVTGFSDLSVGGGKGNMAIPAELHGADVPSAGRSDATPSSAGMMTGALDTGRLATAGDTAGTNYGPNLGFPFPNGEHCARQEGAVLTLSPPYFWYRLSGQPRHGHSPYSWCFNSCIAGPA